MAVSMAAWRKNAKLSQEEMAEKMGISRDQYHKIENGKIEVKPFYLYAFCQIVGCKPEEISMPVMSTKRSEEE
jgi:transcriptional regulator with XRE-family HTH domain